MFINDFSLTDHAKGITISEVALKKLNILVGTSGAGKTTIMHGVYSITRIALGDSSPADEWTINFIDNEGRKVSWSGLFSNDIDINDDEKEQAELIKELLIVDDLIILEKDKGVTKLNGNILPVLDKHLSNVFLLRDDELIKPIYDSMNSIVIILNDSRAHTSELSIPILSKTLLKKASEFFENNPSASVNDFNMIQRLDCRTKPLLAFMYDKERFEYFNFIYTSIFDDVEEVMIEMIKKIKKGTSELYNDSFEFNLKLTDGTVVYQQNISSGMFKTMMIISELVFSSKNIVIFIDEIENSLGVNCLPDMIQEIKMSDNQCIISTHHPRIVNDIPPENWLVINRNGGHIKANKAVEIINSSSNHDKFIQLINSCIFKGK